MEIKKLLENKSPHLVAVITFILLSYAYFFPVLEGKVLKANDSMVSIYSSKEINDFRASEGKEPLWTNAIFSGMPAYLISTKFPGNLFKHLDNLLRILKMPISVLLLSMAGFYLVLIMFGVNPWLSIAGALAFGFSSYMFQIIAAGHNTKAVALIYMAPFIGSVWYAYRRDAIKGALLAGLFLSLELLANHPQITYYAMICLMIFGITEFIFAFRSKTIAKFVKTTLILIIPFLLAIGVNYGFLSTTMEYGKYSIRGKSDLASTSGNSSSGLDRDYITQWSYGVGESFNLMIPNFKGGSSKPFDRDSETVKVLRQNNNADAASGIVKYWGAQPSTEGPSYLGAIVIFLFVLGILIVKGVEKWWLITVTALSLMLAWGHNFMPLTNLFIDFFPGYNKFRAVTMILVIAQFCVPLLGLLALNKLISAGVDKNELTKKVLLAAAITGGLSLLFIMIPGLAGSFLNTYEADYPAWLKDALIADRRDLLTGDAFRSLVFILLAAGVLYAFLKNKLQLKYLILILGLLILVDLWGVGKRYLNADRFENRAVLNKTFNPSFADSYILRDITHYRVLNLASSPFNDNTPTAYYHNSIGGYHGAKLRRYQELIDSAMLSDLSLFNTIKSLNEFPGVLENTDILNMLNTKYIIWNPEAPPLLNESAFGNAWFIENIIPAANANEEIGKLKTTSLRRDAVVDDQFRSLYGTPQYSQSASDTIYLTAIKSNEVIYKSSASTDQVAIFSEIYYPAGWKSFIDGKEVPHFRANYVLRAMSVPAGDHEIRFSFEPETYQRGNMISLVSSVILILLLAGYTVSVVLKKRREK